MKANAYVLIAAAVAAAGLYWWKNKQEAVERMKANTPATNPQTSSAATGDRIKNNIVYLSDLAKNIGNVVNSFKGGSPKPTTQSDLTVA